MVEENVPCSSCGQRGKFSPSDEDRGWRCDACGQRVTTASKSFELVKNDIGSHNLNRFEFSEWSDSENKE